MNQYFNTGLFIKRYYNAFRAFNSSNLYLIDIEI